MKVNQGDRRAPRANIGRNRAILTPNIGRNRALRISYIGRNRARSKYFLQQANTHVIHHHFFRKYFVKHTNLLTWGGFSQSGTTLFATLIYYYMISSQPVKLNKLSGINGDIFNHFLGIFFANLPFNQGCDWLEAKIPYRIQYLFQPRVSDDFYSIDLKFAYETTFLIHI